MKLHHFPERLLRLSAVPAGAIGTVPFRSVLDRRMRAARHPSGWIGLCHLQLPTSTIKDAECPPEPAALASSSAVKSCRESNLGTLTPSLVGGRFRHWSIGG
jgi:hypothetical protein